MPCSQHQFRHPASLAADEALAPPQIPSRRCGVPRSKRHRTQMTSVAVPSSFPTYFYVNRRTSIVIRSASSPQLLRQPLRIGYACAPMPGNRREAT